MVSPSQLYSRLIRLIGSISSRTRVAPSRINHPVPEDVGDSIREELSISACYFPYLANIHRTNQVSDARNLLGGHSSNSIRSDFRLDISHILLAYLGASGIRRLRRTGLNLRDRWFHESATKVSVLCR